MNWQEVWGVLKWVLAALIAGFVGQFGKSLALALMKRRRDGRAQRGDSIASEPTATSDVNGKKSDLEALAKIDKKRAKAEVKRLKKS